MIDTNLIIIVIILAIVLIISYVLKLKTSKPSKQKLTVELVEAKQLTHDTIIFTFVLPNANRKLGLKIGEHLEIE